MQPLSFANAALYVHKYQHPEPTTPPMLVVRGIPPGTNKQMVKLIFESARSGGGIIKQLDYHKDDGYALIVFENKEGKVPCTCLSICSTLQMYNLELFVWSLLF